jgi:hypothetical protein
MPSKLNILTLNFYDSLTELLGLMHRLLDLWQYPDYDFSKMDIKILVETILHKSIK